MPGPPHREKEILVPSSYPLDVSRHDSSVGRPHQMNGIEDQLRTSSVADDVDVRRFVDRFT
jgi:hypothetical protein